MNVLNQHPHFSQVIQACNKLKSHGFTAWLAGGCVRDELLNRLPKDFDVVTDAKPDQIESVFDKTIPVGKQFGIIIAVIDDVQIEIASFRSDGSYTDGRHPDKVTFSNPHEDAARRDFTINAMFMDPFSGEIHDFFNGRLDLDKKIIRTVGDSRQRFSEDKLRILRAIRFAAELNFEIEEETFATMKTMAKEIGVVSTERQIDELRKILKASNSSKGLKILSDLNLYSLLTGRKSEIGHVLSTIFSKSRPTEIASLALFWGLNEKLVSFSFDKTTCENLSQEAEELMTRYKYSNYEKAMVTGIYKKSWLLNGATRKAQILRIASEPWAKDCLNFIKCLNTLGVEKPTHFDLFQECVARDYQIPIPLLNGEILKSQGIAPGPKMKLILDEALDLQLEGKLEDLPSALEWLKLNTK